MELLIIIVNYHSENLLFDCLSSVYKSICDLKYKVVVVDNNEQEFAFECLSKVFSEVQFIVNRKNIGFAAATNIALKLYPAPFTLLLNPDTVLYPDAIQVMVDFMRSRDEAGIVGAKLVDKEGASSPNPSCTGIPQSPAQALFEYTFFGKLFPRHRLVKDYFLTDWGHDTLREVAMVQGACFMIKKPVIDQIGILDERFFLYWEEADWCMRAKSKGWRVYYLPGARCLHLGGQSTNNKEQDYTQFYKSMYRFHAKHYGWGISFMLRCMIILSFFLGYLKLILVYLAGNLFKKNEKSQISVMGQKIIAQFRF